MSKTTYKMPWTRCLAWLSCLIVGVMLASPSVAQPACPPPEDSQFVSEYLAAFSNCVEAWAAGEKAEAVTEKVLTAKPASTPAGGGFASGLRDSIEDFLPLFSFALDSLSTSDDDSALTLRFNPIRAGTLGSVGLSLTLTEPAAATQLLKSVTEEQQPTLKTFVTNEANDLSDLTWTLKWGYEREADLDATRVWGRSYENYRPLVEDLLLPAVSPISDARIEAAQLKEPYCSKPLENAGLLGPGTATEIEALTIGPVREALGDDFDRCIQVLQQEKTAVVLADKKLDALALIPYLIDNQPQLVFTANVFDRDPLVGREGWSANVAFEKGFDNFNTILSGYNKRRNRLTPEQQGDEDALAAAFWEAVEGLDPKDVKKENKLTFSATYRENDAYDVDRTFGEGDAAIPVAVSLEKSTEWCWKVSWRRNATFHPIEMDGSVIFPSMHLSAEHIDVSDDPTRQDRLVATFTYEIPLPAGTTLPISLSYANHAKFLGEPDEELSAHFGLSYKLPIKIK